MFPICVCDLLTFNQLIGYIIILSAVFCDKPQRNMCCNDSPGKTAARPIYLRGWLPWKALQEVGGKVIAKEGVRQRKGKRKIKGRLQNEPFCNSCSRSSFACFSTIELHVCSVQHLAETGLLTLRLLNSFLAADMLTDGSHTHDNGSVYFELVTIFLKGIIPAAFFDQILPWSFWSID